MSKTLIILTVFGAVASGIVGLWMLLYDLFWRRREQINDRFRQNFRDQMGERAKHSPLFKDLKAMSLDRRQMQESWRWHVQTWIEQSGLSFSVWQVAVASLVLGAIGTAGALAITWKWWLGLAMGLVLLVLPPLAIHIIRMRRRQKLTQQLPEAFEVMSRVLRVGQTTQSAFQVIANDFPAPIAEEFAQSFEQQHLGVSFEVALRDLGRRTGIMEMHIFVVALIVNQRVGGNLAELLTKLASLIRMRVKMQGRVRALTGEGRMQAAVLLALPIVALGALLLLNREYAQVLLDNPRLLAATGVAQVIGALWIRKIIRIDV